MDDLESQHHVDGRANPKGVEVSRIAPPPIHRVLNEEQCDLEDRVGKEHRKLLVQLAAEDDDRDYRL